VWTARGRVVEVRAGVPPEHEALAARGRKTVIVDLDADYGGERMLVFTAKTETGWADALGAMVLLQVLRRGPRGGAA